MPLTDTAIRAAKPREKLYKISDGGGLQLHVTPTGSRLWRLAYRFDGKQRELSIGTYPAVSLADARAERERAKRLLSDSIDPSHRKRVEKASRRTAAENTFRAIGDEYLAKQEREGRAAPTLAKLRWILSDLTYPYIGNQPIASITVPELLAVIRHTESRGRYDTAARIRTVCGQVFRYAIATGRAERDISLDLRGAVTSPDTKHRAALFDPEEIGGLLRAIDGYEGQPATLYALKLAPLVFVRPIELRYAEWTEFDFEGALWRIPAGKLKMRREHIVPLARQALETIRANSLLRDGSRYLFPSLRSKDRPISENTLNAALRRIGYSKEEMTAHGFRRTASTRLNEAGFNRDWIERQLAHTEGNAIRGSYNAAEYLPGRREMMQWWADYLDDLKSRKS